METTNFHVCYFDNVFLINRRYKWQVKKLENFYRTETANFHACCFDFLSIVNDNVISGVNAEYEPRLNEHFPCFRSSVNKMTRLFFNQGNELKVEHSAKALQYKVNIIILF